MHDRQTGTTQRVSVASDSSQGNSDSLFPSISADGRYVAFSSIASNLVSGDTNNFCYVSGEYDANCKDIFIHDRQTGSTERVSVASDGSQGNNGSGYLGGPSISADGRMVAFGSYASNLVEGDTNDSMDIFVHDRQTGSTQRFSLASDGSQGNGSAWEPSISADGRYVAFVPGRSNSVIWRRRGQGRAEKANREKQTRAAHHKLRSDRQDDGTPNLAKSASALFATMPCHVLRRKEAVVTTRSARESS